jgi:hypothetical protein
MLRWHFSTFANGGPDAPHHTQQAAASAKRQQAAAVQGAAGALGDASFSLYDARAAGHARPGAIAQRRFSERALVDWPLRGAGFGAGRTPLLGAACATHPASRNSAITSLVALPRFCGTCSVDFSGAQKTIPVVPKFPSKSRQTVPKLGHRSVSYSVAMLQNVQNSQMHPVLGIFVEHASLPQLAH